MCIHSHALSRPCTCKHVAIMVLSVYGAFCSITCNCGLQSFLQHRVQLWSTELFAATRAIAVYRAFCSNTCNCGLQSFLQQHSQLLSTTRFAHAVAALSSKRKNMNREVSKPCLIDLLTKKFFQGEESFNTSVVATRRSFY